jgi:hypothetical protein
MKVENNKKCTCMECGTKWKDTREMFTILLCGKKLTICHKCLEELETKSLHMNVQYNSRLKSQTDIKRQQNENVLLNGEIPFRPNREGENKNVKM